MKRSHSRRDEERYESRRHREDDRGDRDRQEDMDNYEDRENRENRNNRESKDYREKGRENKDYREKDRENREREKDRENRNRDRDDRDRDRENRDYKNNKDRRNRQDKSDRKYKDDYRRRRDPDDSLPESRSHIDRDESSKEFRDSNHRKRRRADGDPLESQMEKDKEKTADEEKMQREKRTVELLTSRTGGAYIPPAKLKMMQAEITDKSGAAYQRIAWEALKKSIHGYINKVNTSNIGLITRELLKENIVRGRGLLARSIIQAQAASPTFTPVYASLTAIINSKFPNIGELILKRLVIQFKRGFRRNDKPLCISSGTFIAHLVNQRVAHEILALEILTLLVETPTDDSVEVAIAFLKECGMKLTEVSRKGIEAIFEMLRNILHEGQLDKRVQYMIEVMFQIRKDGFKDHEAVPEELDLVEEDNQFTHLVTLDEATDTQDILNVFKFDEEYVTNEDRYKQLSKEILGSDVSGSESEEEGDGESSAEEDSDAEQAEVGDGVILDNTETNLTALRRTIYLTIHSSLDFEECAHKLMKMQLKPGQEIELCHMFLDCCAEMRTYEKFFGLLAGRFCAINKMYVTPFEQIFKDSYHTIHRLDTNKLRNVAKFFAHLLFTDSISWEVLSCIKLNEEDTTSSNRIFIKILFQELSEYMGLSKLNQRVKDVTLQEAFQGLFPRDDPKNTRFAINFFTSIGLGGLTDDLREHLKTHPKPSLLPPVEQKAIEAELRSGSSPSSSSSSSPSSTSEEESSSSSSSSSSSGDSGTEISSEEEEKKKKKRTNKKKHKRKEASSSSSSSKRAKRGKAPAGRKSKGNSGSGGGGGSSGSSKKKEKRKKKKK